MPRLAVLLSMIQQVTLRSMAVYISIPTIIALANSYHQSRIALLEEQIKVLQKNMVFAAARAELFKEISFPSVTAIVNSQRELYKEQLDIAEKQARTSEQRAQEIKSEVDRVSKELTSERAESTKTEEELLLTLVKNIDLLSKNQTRALKEAKEADKKAAFANEMAKQWHSLAENSKRQNGVEISLLSLKNTYSIQRKMYQLLQKDNTWFHDANGCLTPTVYFTDEKIKVGKEFFLPCLIRGQSIEDAAIGALQQICLHHSIEACRQLNDPTRRSTGPAQKAAQAG